MKTKPIKPFIATAYCRKAPYPHQPRCLCIPLDAASVEALRDTLVIDFYIAGIPVNSHFLAWTVLNTLGIPQKKAKK